jgi:hypothetical protein
MLDAFHRLDGVEIRADRFSTEYRCLRRFMFFSKRAFNALGCSSRCFAFMSFALIYGLFLSAVFQWPLLTRPSYGLFFRFTTAAISGVRSAAF